MPQVGVITEIDFPKKLKYPLGERWVIPGWYAYDNTQVSLTSGKLYYAPIFVPEPTMYIRIGIKLNIAKANKLARLGIYAWDNGVPGALILDAGTVSVAAPTGTKSIVISQELQRGYYFTALVSDSNPSIVVPDLSYGGNLPVAGWDDAPGYNNYCILVTTGRVADVAGGLADPAPTVNEKAYEDCMVWLREN